MLQPWSGTCLLKNTLSNCYPLVADYHTFCIPCCTSSHHLHLDWATFILPSKKRCFTWPGGGVHLTTWPKLFYLCLLDYGHTASYVILHYSVFSRCLPYAVAYKFILVFSFCMKYQGLLGTSALILCLWCIQYIGSISVWKRRLFILLIVAWISIFFLQMRKCPVKQEHVIFECYPPLYFNWTVVNVEE